LVIVLWSFCVTLLLFGSLFSVHLLFSFFFRSYY
jgi:hypothetical protein